MSGSVLPIGEHQAQAPDLDAPCAACAGDAAIRAVADAFYDLTHNRAFPESATCGFWERFGSVRVEMAAFLAERAIEAAKRDDHDACDKHREEADHA